MNNLNVFARGYLPWTYIGNWGKNISQFFRNFKWAYQRITKGYADCDTWDLDSYYSELFYQTLLHLAENTHGYPIGETPESWDLILHEMAEHFLNTQEWNEDIPVNIEINKAWEEMDKYVSDWSFVEVPDSNYSTLKETHTDEVAYNRAKKKWLKKEKIGAKFRDEEKDKAFDMMKKYFFNLWD